MFVRFRRQGKRVQVSLVETRRASGKVLTEHIGALGSVDAAVSVRERLAFWAGLPERLARLGNRVCPDEQARIYAALHGRIPMVTPDEQRSIQEENAKDDERFWDTMRNLNASHIEGYKAHIALAQAKIAEMEPEVAKAAERVEVARSRVEKLRRGETVSGGLGKRPDIDVVAILKAAGWTPSDFRHARLLWSLSKAEFETVSKRTDSSDAVDRAFDREARRIIRARE